MKWITTFPYRKWCSAESSMYLKIQESSSHTNHIIIYQTGNLAGILIKGSEFRSLAVTIHRSPRQGNLLTIHKASLRNSRMSLSLEYEYVLYTHTHTHTHTLPPSLSLSLSLSLSFSLSLSHIVYSFKSMSLKSMMLVFL